MDLLSSGTAVMWIIALVVFVIVEAVTAQLVSVWFAGGSVVALILSLLDFDIKVQIIAFVISSLAFLIIALPTIRKHLKMDSVPMNADSLVGMTGMVTIDIDSNEETGQIKVRGQYWSARNTEEGIIPAGRKVEIKGIEGVHLIVQELKEEK